MNSVMYIAAMPPPLGGQSLINKIVYDKLTAGMNVTLCNVSAGQLDRNFKYHLIRFFAMLKTTMMFFIHGWNSRVLYLSLDSGLGLLYSLWYILLARLFFMKIFVHHHSFTYIDKESRLVNLISFFGRGRISNIFLCKRMEIAFSLKYERGVRDHICSNASIIRSSRSEDSYQLRRSNPPRAKMTVGLLSHLSDEKGLADFLRFLYLCEERNLPIRGVLAGPPVSVDDSNRINAATKDLNGRLEYKGAIYGADKEKFFEDIDCFLFPTRFKVEAQPLVLFEALGHSLPLIANSRGCISDDLFSAGFFLNSDPDFFVDYALLRCNEWLKSSEAYLEAVKVARDLYRFHFESSESAFDELVFKIRGEL